MRKFYAFLLLMAFCFVGPQLMAQSNQYLHYDRQDDYVRLDDASQYIANKDAFSMAGWFYHDALEYGQGMMGFRSPNQGFYLIQLNNGVLECRLETTQLFEFVSPPFTVLPETWQHFAWVYDGSKIYLYVDAVLVGSANASGQITETDIPFTIGRSILADLNFYLGGRSDEVTVWDKALTAADLEGIMMNELAGDEPNLQLYYKHNQGDPGGDNTSIDKLISEVESGVRDADIIGFALTGDDSNFNGELQAGFQTISFEGIPNKLVSAEPFDVSVDASSELPVSLSIVSGPASIAGNTITLDGTPGEVVVAANQEGNGEFSAASEVLQSFQVVDPNQTTPITDLKHPLQGTVPVTDLASVRLAAFSSIQYPELLNVQNVQFNIDGQSIDATDHGNGYYTANWKPSDYGTFFLTVKAFNNYGASSNTEAQVTLVETAEDTQVDAFTDVLINSAITTETITVDLPSSAAAYDQIIGTLELNCPPGGCDLYDRTATIQARTQEGEWFELIHYITPFQKACESVIDLTDFASVLRGQVELRVKSVTFGNGYEWNLRLDYRAGEPTYPHSKVLPMWTGTYQFGDFANLQPVEAINVDFPENVEAARLKLVSSGHGWNDTEAGAFNTGNAAEFYQTEHHVWVDGEQTFLHDYWQICSENPDGCSNQAGTWTNNRAGFCPGAISQFYDFDLDDFVSAGSVELDYVFAEDYVDQCHPNNPNCVTGVTCVDCDNGFNPNIVVGSALVMYSNEPFESEEVGSGLTVLPEPGSLKLFPNPTNGIVELSLKSVNQEKLNVEIFNTVGVLIANFEKQLVDGKTELDLSGLAAGHYLVTVRSATNVYTQKLSIQ